jgi:NAD(P)-dependent dehydrogenase (short-subunit alcohol dehydrogenase family)
LAPTGITVNAIAPGPTETELFRANNPPGSENELISYWDNADWYRQLGKTSLDT